MRLKSITITNLAAFESFSTELPAVGIIQGANGKGKTSLLEVIKYAFGRRPGQSGSRGVEHDPGMLHGQAESGEAVLTFDDGSLLRVAVTTKETSRMTRPKDGKRWNRSSQDIEAMADALSYDPVKFRDMEPAKRIETFLRIAPVSISQQEIAEAVGGVAKLPPALSPSLEAVNDIHDSIYAARTAKNTSAAALEAHAGQLEAALPPPVDGGDWGAEAERLEAERDAIDAGQSRQIGVIQKVLRDHVAELSQARAAGVASINEDINAKIALLEAERQERIEAVSAKDREERDAANTEAQAAIAAISEETAPKREALTAAIAQAKERMRSADQAKTTQAAAEKARREATELRQDSQAMTAALDRLKALKVSVASRLGVPGVTIAAPKPGLPVDICREEGGALVPFSKWNDTAQILFCLKVGRMSHKDCGLICIDSIDGMDKTMRTGLMRTCTKFANDEGIQFLMGVATEGELRVTEGVQ